MCLPHPEKLSLYRALLGFVTLVSSFLTRAGYLFSRPFRLRANTLFTLLWSGWAVRTLGRWCLFTTNALDISAFGKLTCVSCRASFKRWRGGTMRLKCLLLWVRAIHFFTFVSWLKWKLTTGVWMTLLPKPLHRRGFTLCNQTELRFLSKPVKPSWSAQLTGRGEVLVQAESCSRNWESRGKTICT